MLFPTVTFAIFFLLVLPPRGCSCRGIGWRLVHARRELRLLRLVELALLLPARLLDGRQPGLRVGIHRERPTDPPGPARRRRRVQPRHARATSSTPTSSSARPTNILERFGLDAAHHIDLRRAARRHLVLHVHGDLVRRSTSTGGTSSPRLINFAVYLSFFPHLVAGPIVRGSEFMPQLERPRDPRRVDTSRAFFLILIGLFKKVVIANYLATAIVDDVFARAERHSSLEVLVGVYGYAVQIYADFCGYTDMAIGLALLLGFRFPQNFDSAVHRRRRSRTSGAAGT